MGIQAIIPQQKKRDTIVFTYSLFTNDDKLILAPMQNLTSLFFRKNFSRFFPQNIDYAFSPFISATENTKKENSPLFKDILPIENKNSMTVVPQILGSNAKQIVDCAKVIERLGYREINLNMGCPKRDIVSRNRGAGLLKDSELLKEIIESLLNNTTLSISLKVRLGIDSDKELENLVPLLNNYPLKSITIHPRYQKQQYEGEVNLVSFEHFAKELKHTIIYNGDIFSVEDFTRLKTRFPYITHWMIGRGALMNPFLFAQIRGIPYNEKEILIPYLKGLQQGFASSLLRYNENTILSKMKEFAKYLAIHYEFDATPLLRESNLSQFNKTLYAIFVS